MAMSDQIFITIHPTTIQRMAHQTRKSRSRDTSFLGLQKSALISLPFPVRRRHHA
jgi:hypothetical protein